MCTSFQLQEFRTYWDFSETHCKYRNQLHLDQPKIQLIMANMKRHNEWSRKTSQMVTIPVFTMLRLLNFSGLAIHPHCLLFWLMSVLCKCQPFQGWMSSKLCCCLLFTKVKLNCLNYTQYEHKSTMWTMKVNGQITEVKQARPWSILR